MDDGVTFDILGINWYSYMGEITNVRESGFDLISYLKTNFGKPVLLTEANRKYGSMGGNETAQAAYISQVAAAMAMNPDVDVFIGYELFDEPGIRIDEQYYGLVTVKQSDGKHVVDKLKPAFTQYQQVILNTTQLPNPNNIECLLNWAQTYYLSLPIFTAGFRLAVSFALHLSLLQRH